ncbi:MAG: DUF3368 domain-containing protein [Anaerolineales bacterium]|nr:DUF3368 domain-containing protein [Anaerolineales bacterium]
MPESWVLNASPIIVLARVGYSHWFHQLAEQVIVPQAVATEIQAGPVDDPAHQIINSGDLQVEGSPPPPAELLAWDLGMGETAVLSFVLANPEMTAILDDAAARRCARSFSLNIKGTLAIVILAKQQELISSAAEVLMSLRQSGFYLDNQIIKDALEQTVGETWPLQQ